MLDQNDKFFVKFSVFGKNHSKSGKNLLNFWTLSKKNSFSTDVILDF